MTAPGATRPDDSEVRGIRARLRAGLRRDSAFWRRFMLAGVSHGPQPLLRYSPHILGWAFGVALQEQRDAARQALRRIHGPRPPWVELRDVAAVFANFASSMTDAMIVGTGRGTLVETPIVNEHHMLSSLARGRGVIVATAQTAGWDLASGMLQSDAARDVLVVMEREPDPVARQIHDATRTRPGIRVIHVGEDPLSSLPLLRHLRQGGVVALKIDRVHTGMRTLPVRFFGEPWEIPAGPLVLGSITGAPIVPSFTRRLGFLEYEPTNCAPVDVPRRATAAQLQSAAQHLATCLETYVRAFPTQWIRFHEM